MRHVVLSGESRQAIFIEEAVEVRKDLGYKDIKPKIKLFTV